MTRYFFNTSGLSSTDTQKQTSDDSSSVNLKLYTPISQFNSLESTVRSLQSDVSKLSSQEIQQISVFDTYNNTSSGTYSTRYMNSKLPTIYDDLDGLIISSNKKVPSLYSISNIKNIRSIPTVISDINATLFPGTINVYSSEMLKPILLNTPTQIYNVRNQLPISGSVYSASYINQLSIPTSIYTTYVNQPISGSTYNASFINDIYNSLSEKNILIYDSKTDELGNTSGNVYSREYIDTLNISVTILTEYDNNPSIQTNVYSTEYMNNYISDTGSSKSLLVSNGSNSYTLSVNPGNYFNVGSLNVNNSSTIVNGSLTVNGTISQTSDMRFKTNINNMSDDVISSLHPVSFEYTNQPGKIDYGFIAQDVIKSDPNLVDSSDPEHLKLNYISIIAHLVHKVNELESKIERLIN